MFTHSIVCLCVTYKKHVLCYAQASDGGSTTTASTSAAVVPRKPVDTFPSSGVPLNNGQPLGISGSLSPSSGPSPAPAALPPPSLPYTNPSPLQVRLIH